VRKSGGRAPPFSTDEDDEYNLLLTDPGVDATADHNYAIRWAARNGHLAVVELLLTVPGVDATDWNNCAIHWAARNEHLAVVERLLLVPGVHMF
jgi:ankyrin repeat protein